MTLSGDTNSKYKDVLNLTQHRIGIKKEYLINNFIFKEEFKKRKENAKVKEYPHNYFSKRNLFNSNYNDIEYHDFEKFFYFCHQFGLNGSSNQVLRDITNGNSTLPILLEGDNKKYWLVSGNVEMLAYKVIGSFPLVKVVDVDFSIIS